MKENKKRTSPLTILIIILVIFFALSEELPEDTFYVLLALLIVLLPVFLIIALVKALWKRSKTPAHSHDRIDHSSDLKINPKTGKVERTQIRTVHSPQEHWKQQLDGLLANGTIDRAEYQALLKHRF